MYLRYSITSAEYYNTSGETRRRQRRPGTAETSFYSAVVPESRDQLDPAGGPSQLSQSRGDQRAESTSSKLAPPPKKI